MINVLEVIDVLRDRIIASAIVPVSDIAWQNSKFEPSGKDIWISEAYIPATENFSDSVNGDEASYIYQLTVNVPTNSTTHERNASNTAVDLGSLFSTAEVIKTTNYNVSVTNTNRSFQGKLDDAWYSVVIDININIFE